MDTQAQADLVKWGYLRARRSTAHSHGCDAGGNLSFQWYFVPATTIPDHLALHENGHTQHCAVFGILDRVVHRVREHMLASRLLVGTEPVRVVRVGNFTIRKSMLSK